MMRTLVVVCIKIPVSTDSTDGGCQSSPGGGRLSPCMTPPPPFSSTFMSNTNDSEGEEADSSPRISRVVRKSTKTPRMFRCSECSAFFGSRRDMTGHVQNYHHRRVHAAGPHLRPHEDDGVTEQVKVK